MCTWLHRLVPVIDKHLSHCQGGFRVGSGVKEQLWALLEFMEEGDTDETERIFCTTDVHKAFDQVYRNGTIYLLYGMGRGRSTGFLPPYARTRELLPLSFVNFLCQSDFQVSKTIFDSREILFFELLLLFSSSCYFLELLLGSSIWWRELGETPSGWEPEGKCCTC